MGPVPDGAMVSPARPHRPDRGLVGMDSRYGAVLDELAAEAVGWPGRTAVPGGPMAWPATWPDQVGGAPGRGRLLG
jgi:hypothetical protein